MVLLVEFDFDTYRLGFILSELQLKT